MWPLFSDSWRPDPTSVSSAAEQARVRKSLSKTRPLLSAGQIDLPTHFSGSTKSLNTFSPAHHSQIYRPFPLSGNPLSEVMVLPGQTGGRIPDGTGRRQPKWTEVRGVVSLSVELTWSSVGIDAVVFLLRVAGESSGRRRRHRRRARARSCRTRARLREGKSANGETARKTRVGRREKCAFREKGVKSEEGRRLMRSDLRKAGIYR